MKNARDLPRHFPPPPWRRLSAASPKPSSSPSSASTFSSAPSETTGSAARSASSRTCNSRSSRSSAASSGDKPLRLTLPARYSSSRFNAFSVQVFIFLFVSLLVVQISQPRKERKGRKKIPFPDSFIFVIFVSFVVPNKTQSDFSTTKGTKGTKKIPFPDSFIFVIFVISVVPNKNHPLPNASSPSPSALK